MKIEKLITVKRFDLGFKLLFLDCINAIHTREKKEAYLSHIKAITAGTFQEFDDYDKDTKEKYILVFEKLNSVCKRKEFDGFSEPIPVSGSIICNGAHRLSCCVYHKKTSEIEFTTQKNKLNYDHFFFASRGVCERDLDQAAIQLSIHDKRSRIVLLWGMDTSKSKFLTDKYFKNKVLYEKELTLRGNGKVNIIEHVYEGEEWIVPENIACSDLISKAAYCFKTVSKVKILLVTDISDKEIIRKKMEIRREVNRGKHSIHTSDTHAESVRLSSSIFNDAFVQFINSAEPRKFQLIEKLIELKKRDVGLSELILTGSVPLAIYGIRNNRDVDYLPNSQIVVKSPELSSHLDQNMHYSATIDEIYGNTFNYFVFRGFKFLSINLVREMKKNRNLPQDVEDVRLIDSVVDGISSREALSLRTNLRSRFYMYKDNLYMTMEKNRLGVQVLKMYKFLKKAVQC